MAASNLSEGHRCEFISSVPDYLYCKECTLVARRLNITSCCGESFCHVCITDLKKEGEPCPSCGEKDYNYFGHVREQKQIASLEVYCSMRERGCEWSGTLEQLDTHLDRDQDNCQYVDTECPLHCLMAIPKNKVEQHVAQHCTKRPYVCQHCNFKATYEEIVEIHLAECKYVPLQCPNLCGVTFERDFMEDHMKMCRLEEVGCEFSDVGCKDRFIRENQEEHATQDIKKHLTLTASLAVDTKEQLQQKLLEQDKKHKDEVDKLKDMIQEQEKKLKVQLQTQDQMHKEVEKLLKQQLMECKKRLQIQNGEGERVSHRQREQENKLDQMKASFQQSFTKLETKLNERLQSQNMDHQQRELKLKQVIEDQKKNIQELKQTLVAQEQRFHGEMQKILSEEEIMKMKLQQQHEEHELEKMNNMKKIEEQEKKLQEHQLLQDKLKLAVKKLDSSSGQHGIKLDDLSRVLGLNRSFVLENFTLEKQKDSNWYSPAMYTHALGYKFYIRVNANGRGYGHGKAINVLLQSMSGEFDKQLNLPVKIEFTIELINQHGGENATCTTKCTWEKLGGFCYFNRLEMDDMPRQSGSSFKLFLFDTMTNVRHSFLKHSDIDPFLVNDTLHFNISKITIT